MSKSNISYESAGAPTWLVGLKIFGYCILAGIMSVFIYFSITMLSNSALKAPSGYRIYEVIDNKQVLKEELTWEEYEARTDIHELITDDTRLSGEFVLSPKNDICAVLLVGIKVLTQTILLSVLLGLTGYYVWREGDRDRNLVKHHERTPTPLRGLWIGLIACIPSFVLYGALCLGTMGVFAVDSIQGVYRLLTPPFMLLVSAIMPTDIYPATAMNIGQLLLLLLLQLVVPATCAVAYQLGYRRVFKKKKKKRKTI